MSGADPAAPRSRFVTGLAWMIIASGGLWLLSILFEHLIGDALDGLTSLDSLGATAGIDGVPIIDPGLMDHLPTIVKFAMAHSGLFELFDTACAAAMTAAGIGLLRRRSWGRRGTIALLAFSIVCDLIGLVVTKLSLPAASAMLGGTDPQTREIVDHMMSGAFAMAIVISIVICGFSAWLIVRLRNPAVVAEFD